MSSSEHLSDYIWFPCMVIVLKDPVVYSVSLKISFLFFFFWIFSENSSFITCFDIDLTFSRIVYYFAIP